ncbi:glycosyltransferase [Falsirhodobacter algicola]|uniref:Glycosyltransferase n=1 Tax=Falsirhodobacter algicola TaxID=2692330 RepID=A0A8J8SL50_9RHOB|nr:glycosyltransferase family 2 protein [Falsirhodobacter algicola]QUS36132.1 glycosyltransferase [Falsirhodobacter algicola]
MLQDCDPLPAPRRVIVAVPVRNEEARIQRHLRSLDRAARRAGLPVTVLILVNNTADGTVPRIRAAERQLGLRILLHEVEFPPELANAGNARRLCMDLAVTEDPDAALLTTDADTVVTPDWIAAALNGLGAADLVCGLIRMRPAERILGPAALRLVRIEARYADLLHEARFGIDRMQGRQPHALRRPHYMEAGATMALRARTYDALGGLPAVASSEDRALAFRAEAHGLTIGYSDAMQVWVSARIDGRAQDGMAACLLARQREQDPLADQAMLAVPDLVALWEGAAASDRQPFPDRSVPLGRRLRVSDLKAALPELEAFVAGTVRRSFTDLANAG